MAPRFITFGERKAKPVPVSEKTALRHNRWKRQILEIIRTTENPSRASIKRATGLSMESSLSLVEELLAEGLILPVGKEERGSAGRKATVLKINGDGCYFIGVRFSAGGLSGVCMNFDRSVIAFEEREFAAPPTARTMVDEVEACIQRLMDRLGERKARLRGIGVGAPGIIDPQTGVISRYVHIPDWRNVPLGPILQQRFHTPVYVEHGVKSTARHILARQPGSSFLFVQMGRGISMCVAVEGRILNGASYLAGEIGHMRVDGNDLPCECGKRGCLETLAASGAILSAARQEMDTPRFAALRAATAQGRPLNLQTLCQLADAGCPGCLDLVQKAGGGVACMLAAAMMVVNPDQVLMKGRLSESQTFREQTRQALAQLCLPEILKAARISYLPAHDQMDALGAAEIPFSREFAVEQNGNAAQRAFEASL